jgi:hypothetical protein
MNTIRKLTALIASVSAILALAQPVSAMNINRGNWSILANSLISIILPDKTSSEFHLQTGAEYFFRNRFSGGGEVLLDNRGSGYNDFRIGPALTYHLMTMDRLSIPAHGAVLFGNYKKDGTNTYSYLNFEMSISAEYFLISAISVGPRLVADFFVGDILPNKFALSILGDFKLYF